jgi:hypothetical protein
VPVSSVDKKGTSRIDFSIRDFFLERFQIVEERFVNRKLPLKLFLGTCLFLSASFSATGDTRQQIEMPVHQSIDTRQGTQKQEEQWRREKEKLINRFEALQAEQERLQNRKKLITEQIEATNGRLAAKKKELADIEQISNQIEPFLDELMETIKRLLKDDLPFLTSERRQRVDRLDALMTDPEVDVSEKYRKAMEALTVEAEYGLTIETYQEKINIENKTMLADIFRLGRIGLFFQSLDHQHGGFYNVASGRWESLPASHNQAIQAAIEIAAKRRPVEMLTLPLGRMTAQ